jgi:D-glycero-alpha-D-manno-heptose-7-phosphate kinase
MTLIRAKAPLRITFAGGGTDVPPFPELEGGCVLNATIDSFAWGSLRPRQDGEIHIRSVDLGLSLSYKNGNQLTLDGQLDLVKVALLKMEAHNSHGFDVFLHSDAPPGTGLGSSSALVVALVGLVKEFKNLPLTEYEIADLAYVIERKELGIKGGLQDQYASAFGGFNFTEFYKDRVVVNQLRISQGIINELEHNSLLCFTGTTRQSDQIIADQTQRYTSQNRETVEGLRQQKELAVEMKNLLLRGELNSFGELLHVAWESKKRFSPRITTPAIEELYKLARAHGALGGKVIGAGGGGYMLLYCEFERKHEVIAALKKIGAIPTDFAFEARGIQNWRVNEAHNQSRSAGA